MSIDVLLISLSLLIWGAGEGMFYIFQPLYLQQFGADPQLIGGVLGAVGLSMAVAQAPAGYLADRIGSRPLMWSAWILGTLSAGIMALARSLPVFVAGLILYGLTAFVSTPMSSYVADMRGKWEVGRAFTLTQALYSLGAVIGPTLGGWIGQQYGLASVYLVAFFVFLLSFIVVLFIHPQPETQHSEASRQPRIHRNPHFWKLLPFFFLTVLATFLPQTLTPNYLQNQQGMNLNQIGQLGSIGSIGVVIIMLGLGHLKPVIGVLVGQLAISLYAILLWHGTGFAYFALGYLFIGGYRLARMMILAYARPMIPTGQTGSAFGIIELVNGSALFLAPILGGWLYGAQPDSLYTASLIIGSGAILLNLIFLPDLQRAAINQLTGNKEMKG